MLVRWLYCFQEQVGMTGDEETGDTLIRNIYKWTDGYKQVDCGCEKMRKVTKMWKRAAIKSICELTDSETCSRHLMAVCHLLKPLKRKTQQIHNLASTRASVYWFGQYNWSWLKPQHPLSVFMLDRVFLVPINFRRAPGALLAWANCGI